jgi:hypothetical protein
LVLSGLSAEPALLLTFAGLTLGLEVALTDGPWAGALPTVLCHEAEVAPQPEYAPVALPFDGDGPRSMLGLAAEAEAHIAPPRVQGGAVTLEREGRTLRWPEPVLIAMAYGLQGGADGWFGAVDQLERPENLLAALVRLAQGEQPASGF